MNVLINICESFLQCILSIFKLLIMAVTGLVHLGTMLTESMNVLMEVTDFLPTAVGTAFFAVLGIMVTLRLLGALVHV